MSTPTAKHHRLSWTKPTLACLGLLGLLLLGCSPSQAERDAQATRIAFQIYATLTAAAPTFTPTAPASLSSPTSTATSTRTPTATKTPTVTPTPSRTPTLKPTVTPSPTLPPIPILAKGWNKVEIRTLCLKVEQSYPELEHKVNEPIQEVSRDLLTNMGIRVVSVGTPCDAQLAVALVGRANGSTYSKPGETTKRYCYSGADYDGTMSLSAKGVETWTVQVGGTYTPFLLTGPCQEKPSPSAEYGPAWRKTLVDGFDQLWGVPAMLKVLKYDSSDMRTAATEALRQHRDLGPETVPYLVEALEMYPNWDLQQELTTLLAEMEKKAWQAIPALIRKMERMPKDDMTYQWTMYNFALVRITGRSDDPNPSCFDAKCTSEWWKEWWGNGRPAP